jgi:membrane protein
MSTSEATLRKDVDPTDIPKPGRRAVLRRTLKEFRNDNLTDWAAALTYYAVLALFPALVVLVALVGLFGQYPQTTNALLDILRQAGVDPDTLKGLKGTINDIVRNKGGAGALLGFGLLGALWSASGYIGAFMRASNAIYEKPEGRPFWKLRPLQVVVTLVMTLMFALVLVALVVSGPLAEAIGSKLGFGDSAVTVWNIAKWPVLALVVSLMLATLYYVSPNAKLPKFQWISPGAVVALTVWIVASVGFFFYARNFGSYNKTYGTLGGAITLLVWLWITNVAILFGQELNAEIERGRELAAGKPAVEDIQLPLRQEPKKDPEHEAAEISREAVGAGGGNGGRSRDEGIEALGADTAHEGRFDRPQ